MPPNPYLTVAEAIAIQRFLAGQLGGAAGVRDLGKLENALARPRKSGYRELHEKAAALMEAVANGKPFAGGNARAAFALADTFLRLNGCYLEAEAVEAAEFIGASLRRGKFHYAAISGWIFAHLRKLPPMSKTAAFPGTL